MTTNIDKVVGGAGIGSHTSSWGFSDALDSTYAIFSKRYHRTQAEECLKIFVLPFFKTTIKVVNIFETFHSSCSMRFYVVNWHKY